MITLIKYGALSGGEKYNVNQMWIDGLSTDSKPTTTIDGLYIPNGSVYTEVDTGKTFMLDKDSSTWHEVSIGGGGTSGGLVLQGVTTTQLSEGATTNPITINGQSYTAQANDMAIYGYKEFYFDGTYWHEFGDYSGLGTAAYKDVPTSGNASTTQVVMGDDTRLTDARNAADVSAWAKAANKPSYGGSEITLTDYAKASSKQNVAASDSTNSAIGKIEYRVESNESNISSIQDKSDRIVMDSNETTILYFQGTQPSNPHDGDCWIDCSTTT